MAQRHPNIDFQIKPSGARTGFRLDVDKISDFPMALNYSIKDVQDPQSSKGSFSKTFSIPATKHNNTVLKSIFSDSVYDSFQYLEDYDALIFVDGLLVLQGKFQIAGTTYRGKPQSYECVVFGDNYKWVNALSELNLCDINFDAGNLFPHAPAIVSYTRAAMEETWGFNEAGEIRNIGGVDKQTHIVYPLVNNGKWAYYDPNNGYNSFVAPEDMSPAFYIYNMLKCIFAEQGYTLVSNFMEQDWFKKLVSYVPRGEFQNADVNIADYSFEYETAVVTDWKNPLNLTDTTQTNDCGNVIGNSYNGGVTNLQLVCPSCDPSNLINNVNLQPNFDVDTPAGMFSMGSNSLPTIAGWWWDNYGFGYSSSARVPFIIPNQCGSGNSVAGHDWSCITCDPTAPIGTLTQTSQNINCDVFSTPFLGVYEFNGGVKLEMDNQYALDNDVYPITALNQPGNNPAYGGTFNGGSGINCGGVLSTSPYYEAQYHGVTFVANLFIMHYKDTTNRTHVIPVASQRIEGPECTPLMGPNCVFCGGSPLPASPNLEFDLNFSGTQIDVLSQNDKVWLYAEVTVEYRDMEETDFAGSNDVRGLCQMKYRQLSAKFSGNLTPSFIQGSSINLASLLPCDTSQLDWVNGLTGLFNLMWESDEELKQVKVEPRDNFFRPITEAISWSDKLDKSQNEKGEYIYDALKRNLCFTYENDGTDGFVEERNRRKGQVCELGSHALNLGDLYINEEQKIGTEFYSPTYMFYDKTISNNMGAYKQPFIPVIHEEYSAIWNATTNADLPAKNLDFAPRILIWFGYQPLNQEDGAVNANTWRWGWDNNDGVIDNLTRYPFAGVYSDQNGNLAGPVSVGAITYPRPSLYYEEGTEVNAVSTPAPYDVCTGLYEMFWEFNILSLIDRPKIKKAFFKLSQKDIAELDFSKLIHLRLGQSDTYWILNKIIDYKPNKNVLTQVELFEYHNARPLKQKFPTLNTGFGINNTGQWTDFNVSLVSGGKTKVPTDSLTNTLGVYNATKKPLIGLDLIAQNYTQKTNATIKTYYSDGTRVPVGTLLKNSVNIGDSKANNSGSITIGSDLQQHKANVINIGNENNIRNNSAIQVSVNNRNAFVVGNDGIFKEGGGGAVYYEDPTTGEIKEVITGVIKQNPIGRNQDSVFYTRCVKEDENII